MDRVSCRIHSCRIILLMIREQQALFYPKDHQLRLSDWSCTSRCIQKTSPPSDLLKCCSLMVISFFDSPAGRTPSDSPADRPDGAGQYGPSVLLFLPLFSPLTNTICTRQTRRLIPIECTGVTYATFKLQRPVDLSICHSFIFSPLQEHVYPAGSS